MMAQNSCTDKRRSFESSLLSYRCQGRNRLVKNEPSNVSDFMDLGVSPRQYGRMGRGSERNLGYSLNETHTPRSQSVNMGRGNTLRVIAGDVVCPQGIQGDQKDIRISRLRSLRPLGFGTVRAAGTAGQKHSKRQHLDAQDHVQG